MALACDITRVASMQWSRAVSQTRFTWLDITEGHHDLSHRPDSDPGAVGALTNINTWYARQFAGLIARLKATPDGAGGTLFDNTLLLWCNELAKGNTHGRLDAATCWRAAPAARCAPAASCATKARRCRTTTCWFRSSTRWGCPTREFGKPEWCTGPLAGLL